MSSEAANAATPASPANLRPVIMPEAQAQQIRPFGIDMKVMLGAEHTGGMFSAILGDVRPGDGAPPHLHRDREEYFFVLAGTYWLSVNGEESTIGPGTMVFVPRGTVHTFKNISGEMGKVLEWTIPGGNGDYFREINEMQAADTFSPETFAAINRKFVTEFVG